MHFVHHRQIEGFQKFEGKVLQWQIGSKDEDSSTVFSNKRLRVRQRHKRVCSSESGANTLDVALVTWVFRDVIE